MIIKIFETLDCAKLTGWYFKWSLFLNCAAGLGNFEVLSICCVQLGRQVFKFFWICTNVSYFSVTDFS